MMISNTFFIKIEKNISFMINVKLCKIIEHKLPHLEGYPSEIVDAQ